MKRILTGFLVLSLMVALFAICTLSGAAAEQADTFSFLVFGDNRLPGYFPFNSNQTDEVRKYFEEMELYAFGPYVSLEIDMGFHPETRQMDWIKYWVKGAPEKYSLAFLERGWPRLVVEGPRADVAMRSEGQEWVYTEMLRELKKGAKDPLSGPSFCLNTGDMTFFGYFGKSRDESPFWHDFYERFVSQLPPGSPEGLPGRFFPAPGNHETALDENLEGLLTTVTYLPQMGFTVENRVYKFDYGGCRFIFLDTGDMDYRKPSAWGSKHPDFAGQMAILTKWLKEAKEEGTKRAFVTFHCPAFCISGFGPLPPDENPHAYLKPFASELEITVFNGHVHTTELYEVDEIRYLVLGGGGAEQDYQTHTPPKGYPEELYWKGEPRVEDYNYLRVEVFEQGTRMWLRQYRPGAENPVQEVELYKE